MWTVQECSLVGQIGPGSCVFGRDQKVRYIQDSKFKENNAILTRNTRVLESSISKINRWNKHGQWHECLKKGSNYFFTNLRILKSFLKKDWLFYNSKIHALPTVIPLPYMIIYVLKGMLKPLKIVEHELNGFFKKWTSVNQSYMTYTLQHIFQDLYIEVDKSLFKFFRNYFMWRSDF